MAGLWTQLRGALRLRLSHTLTAKESAVTAAIRRPSWRKESSEPMHVVVGRIPSPRGRGTEGLRSMLAVDLKPPSVSDHSVSP